MRSNISNTISFHLPDMAQFDEKHISTQNGNNLTTV